MDYALYVDTGDIVPSGPNWSLLRNYGEALPSPPPVNSPTVNRYSSVQLYTASGPLEIRAAATGVLKADFAHTYGVTEGFDPADFEPVFLQDRIAVTLSVSPFDGMDGGIDPTVNRVGDFSVMAFRYEEIDPTSMLTYLVDKLRTSVFPSGGLAGKSDDEIFEMFLAGRLEVKIGVGETFATSGAYGSNHFVDFSVHTDQGPIHPSYFYDEARDKVTDGTGAVDDFLAIVPNTWPLLNPTGTVGDVLTATAADIYPWSALKQAKLDHSIGLSDWTTIKENQKQLFEEQLKQRTGHATGSADFFQFDDNDRKNLFMLEAVTEFFLNYDEPWDPALSPSPTPWSQSPLAGTNATLTGTTLTFATPISITYLREMHHWILITGDEARPGKMYRIMEIDSSGAWVKLDSEPSLAGGASTTTWRIDVRIKVNFLDPEGSSATVSTSAATSVVRVDSDTDFSEVVAGFSTIYFEEADEETLGTKTFLITDFDPVMEEVSVEAELTFSGSSDWRIVNPPKILVIDPLGPRIKGTGATSPSSFEVDLDDEPVVDLFSVNEDFDRIYLEEDTYSRRTFLIDTKATPNNTLTVDGMPSFPSGTSDWSIPAGIGGSQNNVVSVQVPDGTYDNYDGMLFLVHDNQIQETFPWSSYSSRKYVDKDYGSSVKGNRRYDVVSFTSSHEKLHYCFKVEDPWSGYDGVIEALHYVKSVPAPWDEENGPTGGNGKTEIRLHWGYTTNPEQNNGSAGCLVSHSFLSMRNMMVDMHNASYKAQHGVDKDPDLAPLTNVSQARNDELHSWYRGVTGWDGLTWKDKLRSRMYLIRPDELPHTP